MSILITYSKIKDLDEEEREVLISIVEKQTKKIERTIKDGNLIVNIKVSKKETRKRYEIHLSLETDKKTYKVKNPDSEKGGDWDLAKAAHITMNALDSEIQHNLKSEGNSYKKGFFKNIFE